MPTLLGPDRGTAGEEEHERDHHGQRGNKCESPGNGEDGDAVLNYGLARAAAHDHQLRVVDAVNAAVVEQDPAAFLGEDVDF